MLIFANSGQHIIVKANDAVTYGMDPVTPTSAIYIAEQTMLVFVCCKPRPANADPCSI